jgi:hypothetical protein
VISRTRNILDKRDDGPRGYAIFMERRGHIGFQVGAGESNWVSTTDFKNASADGRWHHVAGIAKRLPAQPPILFVDGELRTSPSSRPTPLDPIDNNAPVWIGRHHSNAIVPRDDYFWEGAVDELAFYRRALSPAQIKAIYLAGRAGKCRPK